MAEQSLQIKRNKNIFATKYDAVQHLNSLIDKLDDGEIVLCRYFNNETIQTLIGFETIYNEQRSIAYLDSFSEVGDGFIRDDNGILQLSVGDGLKIDENHKLDVKIDNTVTNFLGVNTYGMSVQGMNADVTKTTEKILVMGGPLDTPTLRSVVDTEDGKPCIKVGTDIQSLLLKLLCKEIFPYNTSGDSWYMAEEVDAGNQKKISYTTPSYALKIAAPTIENFTTGEVEVGTKITFTVSATQTQEKPTSAKISNVTWGYATDYSDNPTINTATTITHAWATQLTNDVYTLSTTIVSGFTGFTQDTITGTTTSLPSYSKEVTVGDGINKITWNITGATYSATVQPIESVYMASNLGKLNTNIKTNKVNGQNLTQITAPTSSITSGVTGVRYSFAKAVANANGGMENAMELNSSNIRKLDSKQSKNSFTISVPENTTHVYIAVPSSKTVKSVADANAFGTDILGSFEKRSNIQVEGAHNYSSKPYTVYIYAPDTKLKANTYTVTLN